MVVLLGVVSKIKAMFTVYLIAFRADTKALQYSVQTYPICDRLHFRDRPGAAPLQKTRAEITVLMCEQNPYPVWFLCRRKSYPLYCENRLNTDLNISEQRCYSVSMSIHY